MLQSVEEVITLDRYLFKQYNRGRVSSRLVTFTLPFRASFLSS
jgi:hypothetical protein